MGNTGGRLAAGSAGGDEGFSSGHASAGVVGVDPDGLPYSEAAEAADLAAPNAGRGAERGGGSLAADGVDGVGVARSAAISTFPTGL